MRFRLFDVMQVSNYRVGISACALLFLSPLRSASDRGSWKRHYGFPLRLMAGPTDLNSPFEHLPHFRADRMFSNFRYYFPASGLSYMLPAAFFSLITALLVRFVHFDYKLAQLFLMSLLIEINNIPAHLFFTK